VNRLLSILFVAAWFGSGSLGAAPVVEANISSRFLVTGEQAIFEVVVPGDDFQVNSVPPIPEVKNLTIRPLGIGPRPRSGPGRRLEYFFNYSVGGYTPGNYTIPALELNFGGEVRRTSPIELRIFEETDLKWSRSVVDGRQIRYAAAFHALKGNPYVGEKQPVEIKIYFPGEQPVEDWGIPDFERDGLSAWRFQPQQQTRMTRKAAILGKNYQAISYPSTMSTNRVGEATLGPASVRVMTLIPSLEHFSQAYTQPVILEIPAIKLTSKALPPGAPEGFDNAIGQFSLDVTSRETEVREGDPVTLSMTVSGTGNLDALQPPKPLDTEGWKLYETSSAERGEERREMWGEVNFRQFMRPLRVQTSIPPFRLVYFDPAKNSYETLLSDAIPLTVLPSTAAALPGAAVPQALPMPLEEMTDILGIAKGPAALLSKRTQLPPWLWQVIPALLVAGLLARIATIKLGPRLHKDPDVVAREKEWRDVERAPEQTGAFYRSVGHFIERWLGNSDDPIIAETLAKRDELCFRQDIAESRIDRSERQRVLRQVRKIALPVIAFFIAFSSQSGFGQESPEKMFEEGRFAEAGKAWLESGPYEQLPADTLFNIGNAAYRLGSPGEAALYYRRALQRQGTHPEARQNLRFLERKFGSITVDRPDYQHQLARVPLSVWKSLVWAAAWLVAIAILIFPATRPGAGIRIVSIIAFVTAPLIAAGALVAWKFYPDDARFAPAKDQVVVVADAAVVRTDAARNAPKVIDAPAGSLCRKITQSGEWAYVAFTNDSRGWIPLADIEPLETTKPAPPKLRPAKGNENNA
jgi:hypothetical protein